MVNVKDPIPTFLKSLLLMSFFVQAVMPVTSVRKFAIYQQGLRNIWKQIKSPTFLHILLLMKLVRDFPANISWSWRRLEDVFNTSSALTILRLLRRLAKTFWRRLKDVLRTSSRRLGRREIVTLKTSWRHILKTSWRHVLKTSWRHVLKTSWRHYGEKQNTYWEYLYLTNLNVHLPNLYSQIYIWQF